MSNKSTVPNTTAAPERKPKGTSTSASFRKLTDIELMVRLTPRMQEMAGAAGLDLLTGRFREDSVAGKLTDEWLKTHPDARGGVFYTQHKPGQHPLEPTMMELVGLFFLPWATAFISDLEWAEVRQLATEISDYTASRELMYLNVTLSPVRKHGGLQYEESMPVLNAVCSRKGIEMPLHGWHALAIGLAMLGYALSNSLRDQTTGEPSTQLEGWLRRVPQERDAQGRFWETPGRWFNPDGTSAKPTTNQTLQDIAAEVETVMAAIVDEVQAGQPAIAN